MHAENFGVVDDGQAVDVVAVVLESAQLGRIVDARGRVLVVLVEGFARKEALENGAQAALIPGVGDAAAVRDLARDVDERVPGYVAVLAEHLKVEERALAVRVRELVLDVPAERVELLALLDDGVKEAYAEDDLAPLVAEHVLLEERRLYVGKGALRVGAQALGRLVGHLDAVLQHRDGKALGGHRAQEEPKVLMHGGERLGEPLHLLLHGQHPRGGQVAVLQEDPVAELDGRVDELLGDRALALAQRYRLQALAHAGLLGKAEERAHRVRAGAQYEDERRATRHVLEQRVQVGRRTLDEYLAEVFGHEERDRLHELVLGKGAYEYELVEGAQTLLVLELGCLLGRREHVRRIDVYASARHVAELQHDGHALQVVGQRLEAVGHVEGDVARARPAGLGEPAQGFGLGGALLVHAARLRAAQEEHPVGGADALVELEYLGAEHEAEDELVLLEEAARHVRVHGARRLGQEYLEPLGQVGRLGRALDRQVEELREVAQAELVHGVDERQVGHHEVHDAALGGDGSVLFARCADVRLGLLGLGEAARDRLRGRLRVVERVDELLVVEYVALGLEQHLEYLVLDGLELILVVVDAHDETVALLLEVGPLQTHHVAEYLVFEARLGHAEVDHRHLDAHLGQVVRIGQLGRHVEAKVRIVLDVAVAQPDEQTAAGHVRLLEQYGLQCRIDLFN